MSGAAAIKAGIVGVSGYSGMELARLLARHPRFQIALATTDKWAGKALGSKLALPEPAGSVVCVAQEEGRGKFGGVDVLFLCTPNEVSMELAPVALAAGTRVVDLSGAFRLTAADYPGWYGFEHKAVSLLGEAVYSMPEATGNAERLRGAKLVSNPGCYPTVSSLAALPFVQAGLIEPASIIIDAKSGTTGAGKKASEEFSFSEVDGDFRAYRVLRHQHQPEIEKVLGQHAPSARVIFTAHLLPTRRGILSTVYGRLTATALASPDLAATVASTLAGFAEGKPFIRIAGTPEEVTLSATVGTNRVLLAAKADVARGILVAVGSMDNLVKGASGQAVQNANLMFGLPETTGLDTLVGHLP